MLPISPMLAHEIAFEALLDYIGDDTVALEQKIDGWRVIAHIEDGHVVLIGKDGQVVSWAPQLAAHLKTCRGRLVLDGEWDPANKLYRVFDLPAADGHISVLEPYQWRREILGGLFRGWTDRPAMIQLIPSFTEPDTKAELVRFVAENRCEGVMVKRTGSSYQPGQRSDDWLKAKLTTTIDVVVMEVGRKGKASLAVGAYENGILIEVGAVAVKRGMAGIQKDDVIEARYRHASEDRRLVEPRFLRRRPDKAAADCTIDQLVFPCKEVLL